MKTNMNSKITILALLLITILFSCKNEAQFTNYKYADKPAGFTCEGVNQKLLNEALYSFEDDITKHYNKNVKNPRLEQAYSQIIRNSVYGRLKLEDIISKHTINVFNALKNESDLWDANNTKSHLNYKGKILKCIANNIKDKNLKTTLNALISTNSMAPKLFGPTIISKYRNVLSDKNLAMYIALDLFYAKFFDLDLTTINTDKPEKKVDLNKAPAKTEVDTHADHNHNHSHAGHSH